MKRRAWLILGLSLATLSGTARAQETPDEYVSRAEEEYMGGNLASALTDFTIFCNLAPKDPNADYAHLFIWLVRSQQNQKTEADTELSDAVDKNWNAAPEAWVSKIAAFFLDQINEKDFFAASGLPGDETQTQQLCEAWYYAGMKRLLAGDKVTAIDYFQKSLATNEKDFIEYGFAQAQLKALGVSH